MFTVKRNNPEPKSVITRGPWGSGAVEAKDTLDKMPRNSPMNAIIGKGCKVKGKIELDGEVFIDGLVEGELMSSGTLTIGESGQVSAKISGCRIKIFGQVEGDIDCREQLELYTGARVIGDILTRSLVVQDGVFFEGHCGMKDSLTDTNKETSNQPADDDDDVLNG